MLLPLLFAMNATKRYPPEPLWPSYNPWGAREGADPLLAWPMSVFLPSQLLPSGELETKTLLPLLFAMNATQSLLSKTAREGPEPLLAWWMSRSSDQTTPSDELQ